MPVTNEQIAHSFKVTDLVGAVVTGLVNANFTKTLTRVSSGAMVSSSETVTVTELGSGWYQAAYTPTLVARYLLVVSHATYTTYESVWEDDVAAAHGSTGPYLTTRAAVIAAFSLTSSASVDARIDSLLASVTAWAESYCNRIFFSASLTEYHDALGTPVTHAFLNRPPVTAVSAAYFSTSLPRVYDSTTLLVDGTDYFVNADTGVLTLMTSRSVWTPAPRIFRVNYTGGYSTIPADVERAAIEIIGTKYQMALNGGQYHLKSIDRGEGSIELGSSQISVFDVPLGARQVFDRYVLRGSV